jgi:hypothetical protein
MKLLAITCAGFGCMTAQAGDGRFGFATHFEQSWSPSAVMPAIASTGVSYIRDDFNSGSWEPQPGVYVQPSRDMGWLNVRGSMNPTILITLKVSDSFGKRNFLVALIGHGTGRYVL